MRQGIKKKITALTITSAMVAATLGGGSFAFAAKNQPQNEGQRPTVATGSSIGVIGEKPNKKPVTPGAIDAKPEPANTAKRKVPKKVKVKKGKNSCVLKTKKQLSKGTYTIKIKGVKVKGETKYETITTKVKVK